MALILGFQMLLFSLFLSFILPLNEYHHQTSLLLKLSHCKYNQILIKRNDCVLNI